MENTQLSSITSTAMDATLLCITMYRILISTMYFHLLMMSQERSKSDKNPGCLIASWVYFQSLLFYFLEFNLLCSKVTVLTIDNTVSPMFTFANNFDRSTCWYILNKSSSFHFIVLSKNTGSLNLS